MSDNATTSRTLRSRDPPADKSRPQTLRKNTRNGVPSREMKELSSSGGHIINTKGRFRAKITDTLKLKLIAQHPRKSEKKAPKSAPKPAPKKTVNKPPVPVTTLVKPETPALVQNGLSALSAPSNLHMPKSYLLYVGNLPLDITKQQLEDHFRKTGGVKSIRIPKEKGSDKGRGYAYVEFKDRISHGIALRLHQTKLAGGRRITVEFTQVGGKQKDVLKRRIQTLTKHGKEKT